VTPPGSGTKSSSLVIPHRRRKFAEVFIFDQSLLGRDKIRTGNIQSLHMIRSKKSKTLEVPGMADLERRKSTKCGVCTTRS